MSYTYNETNLTNLGQLKKVAQRAKTELDGKAGLSTLAAEYSASATYAVGDLCYKDGVLYRCSSAITTAEAWNAAHWTATTVAGEIDSLDGRVDTLENAGYQTASDVSDAIDTAISTVYKPGGSKASTDITNSLLVKANEGKVYNLSDALTLDATSAALFVDAAAGDVIPAGTNIVVINTASSGTAVYKFDKLAGFIDLSGKADKVTSATNGNFAALDANGNLTDSGHKHSDYLTEHQDITGKADKPSSATADNLAAFDASKNPVDSGIAKANVQQKLTSFTSGNFRTSDANGFAQDAGYALASDTNVEDMIHDVWGDPET